jgi:deoxyribose-phosphate aldolase
LKRYKADHLVPIAAVATGFPSGQYALKTRIEEIRWAVESGASEIDIVINRTLALKHDWNGVYEVEPLCFQWPVLQKFYN